MAAVREPQPSGDLRSWLSADPTRAPKWRLVTRTLGLPPQGESVKESGVN
jgi:hypothetical protein